MKIIYKDYVISKIGKSLTYNLIKKVIRTGVGGNKYEGKKTLGSMSLERCIETIIYDNLSDKATTIQLSYYLSEFKKELNNLKQFIQDEQIRTS